MLLAFEGFFVLSGNYFAILLLHKKSSENIEIILQLENVNICIRNDNVRIVFF